MESLALCAEQPNNEAPRQRALIGASMSGLAYSNTWLGIAHSLCQALGARYRVAQGLLHAVILPHAMRFNLPATESKQRLTVSAMPDVVRLRSPASMSDDASGLMERFGAYLKLPRRLRDLGIPESGLNAVAEDSFAVCIRTSILGQSKARSSCAAYSRMPGKATKAARPRVRVTGDDKQMNMRPSNWGDCPTTGQRRHSCEGIEP